MSQPRPMIGQTISHYRILEKTGGPAFRGDYHHSRGCPVPSRVSKGGAFVLIPPDCVFLNHLTVTDDLDNEPRRPNPAASPWGLKRYYGAGHLHFITCSCYRRLPLLKTPRRRDLFLDLLEQARQCYGFVVVGYVVMPEHFHVLISEPEQGTPSTVMQVVKQRFARRMLRKRRRRRLTIQPSLWEDHELAHVWQARFYDFKVWGQRKRVQKLRYMHANPVKRGLVLEPAQWAWSSFRD